MPSLHAAVPILHLRLHRADSFRERSHLDLEICGMDASQGVPIFEILEEEKSASSKMWTRHVLNHVDGICMERVLYQLVQEIHSYLTVFGCMFVCIFVTCVHLLLKYSLQRSTDTPIILNDLEILWRFFASFLSIGRASLQERRRASNTGKLLKLLMPHQTDTGCWFQMGVSKNRGTPKWMVYKGKHYQNGMIWGTLILETPKYLLFSSRTLGKWFPLWRAYFSGGLVQPPTRISWFMELLKMKKDCRSSFQIKVTSVSWCIPLKMQYQCPQFHQPWRYRNVRRHRWQFWLMVPGTKHNGCTNTSKRCSMW